MYKPRKQSHLKHSILTTTKTNNHWKIPVLLSLTCCVTSLQATIEPTDTFSEMPVVLSSNTLEQTASQSPLTISIIDKQMIEASGARTIPDALRLIPGMVVGHSVNEFGDKPLLVVAYHGHSDQFSRQMNVLIDGRSIYEPLQGGVNWYNIPIAMDDIEHIEVTHGPNASTFGSNSFQAVVNIITRRASEDQGHFASINIGSHEIFDATYRYGGSNGDLDYRITLATVTDDGQDRADGSDAYDDVDAGQFDYRLDYQVNSKNQLTYTAGYGKTNQHTEVTTRTLTQPKLPRRIVKDTTSHQLIRWDSTINAEQSFVLKYFYNHLNEDDKFESIPIDLALEGVPGFDPLILQIDKSNTSQRHNVEFTHFINPDNSLDLAWGLSIQNDSVESIYYLDPDHKASRDTYRIFGNMTKRLNRHNSIDLGILLEKSDGTETDTSPRIAYLYHFNNDHTIRVGASQAVRTPFMHEQSGQTFFNAELTIGDTGTGFFLDDYFVADEINLKTEKITSIELGYHGKFMQEKLSVNTRIFQDKLDDLIFAEQTTTTATPDFNGTAFIYNNAHETTVSGLEIEIDYNPGSATRLFVSGALLDITSDDNPKTGTSSSFEESAPDQSYSLLAMHDFNDNYSGSLGFYYVSDLSFTDVNNSNPLNNRNTGGYQKLDLRVAHNIKLGSEQIKAAIIFQNLLDDYSDYDAISNSPEAVVTQNQVVFLEIKVSFR